MIKVLVVDDSAVARNFLSHLLSGAGMKVIGVAADGEEALAFVERKRPDVITMDIYMPRMNGLEATLRIMETNPVPIVIVSGNWDRKEVETTFRALEAGALSIVRRPYGAGHPEHEATVEELVRTVRLMSEVKVVRRWTRTPSKMTDSGTRRPAATDTRHEIRILAMGASAGGPPVLQKILSGLPSDLPAPVLIVQHMAEGFLRGMAEWLGETSGLPLRIASDGDAILPGHAYFAPDGFHMGVRDTGKIFLSGSEPEHGARPSVSYLFRSVAKSYGRNAAAVLLTGMGRDGADAMRLLREKGAVTIAQDKESSAVYGMPEAAVELDAATFVLPPDRISALIRDLTRKSNNA